MIISLDDDKGFEKLKTFMIKTQQTGNKNNLPKKKNLPYSNKGYLVFFSI